MCIRDSHGYDCDRLSLCRGRPPDHTADREPHHCTVGSAAPMSMAKASNRSSARRALDQVAWRLLPLVPFALVLAAWIAYWTIMRPPPATLPAVPDVVAVLWELA